LRKPAFQKSSFRVPLCASAGERVSVATRVSFATPRVRIQNQLPKKLVWT
jgi:hypothetical protein